MRVLCIGDSNTYGFDPELGPGSRYPETVRWVDLLQAMTGWQVKNRGENGREIPHLPAKITQIQRMLSANTACDLTVILLGTNDLLHGCTAEETAARMEAFLTQIRPACRRLLLLAPPLLQPGSWVQDKDILSQSAKLSACYRALAQRLQISFADTALWNIAIAHDGVHFTPAGHRAFAEHLSAYLSQPDQTV